MRDKKPLRKARDAADRLGISVVHVYFLARSGKLPSVRIGGKAIRFEDGAIDRFIRDHRRGKEKAA